MEASVASLSGYPRDGRISKGTVESRYKRKERRCPHYFLLMRIGRCGFLHVALCKERIGEFDS